MTERPRISVVIPVRDGAAFVAEAIESVLAQTIAPDEIVVVDDGSTDGTAGVVAPFAPVVTLVHQEPLGFSAAVNRGVAETDGELLAFLDADDLWTPEKLELQLHALDSRPELDGVYGQAVQFVDRDLVGDDRAFRFDPAPGDSHLLTAVLIRRDSFERVGDLDPLYDSVATVDWHARALEAGLDTIVLPVVVMRRRIHGKNLSLQATDKPRDLTRTMRAHVQRLREQSERREPDAADDDR